MFYLLVFSAIGAFFTKVADLETRANPLKTLPFTALPWYKAARSYRFGRHITDKHCGQGKVLLFRSRAPADLPAGSITAILIMTCFIEAAVKRVYDIG